MYLKGELVGGFVLIAKPNLESIMFVPDEVKDDDFFSSLDLTNSAEINGLWLCSSRKVKREPPISVEEIRTSNTRSGKSHVMVMHNRSSMGLKSIISNSVLNTCTKESLSLEMVLPPIRIFLLDFFQDTAF